ncbi:methyltransferase [Nostoc sp. T09]|uniref:methyltransferase n=1 Tax=Nostoc sp. T09 TaxID=1932621 RepID=UPI000A393BCB|nr:methyltransferase [Nostoc sp. T09]OUL33328.1 methyltransferase [Nostoc sp. T09]
MVFQEDKSTLPSVNLASLEMLNLITSYRVTQTIHVAAKLGIADLLKNAAKSSQELANETATNASALYRILRALASIGIFQEVEHDLFELTPLGQSLRSDVPGSMRAWAMMVGGEHHWQPWGELLHSVQTGKPAFDHVFGMGPFEYYNQKPEAGQTFQLALSGLTQIVNSQIVTNYDFSSIRKIVDIGGGQGSLLSGILETNPGIQGVLFDQPSVIEKATPLFKNKTVYKRCELVAGDFFDSVPTGGDAYILKHIIHDWDDEGSVKILRNCHKAMSEDGKLLVVEMVIPDGNTPFYGKFLDIEMLVGYSGKERTANEYQKLFAKAGFQLTHIFRTEALVSVIEGVRV